MLNGNVNIRQTLRGISDGGDKFIGHAFRLKIQHANPSVIRSHNLSNLAHKPRKRRNLTGVSFRNIISPNAGILSDKDDFTNSSLHERRDFRQDFICGAGLIMTSNIRDGTKCTEPIAAIRYLYVCACSLNSPKHAMRRNNRLGRALNSQNFRHHVNDAIFFVCSYKSSDLRKLIGKL